MTIDSLRAALDELEAVAGVPRDASLMVAHYQQGGWELTAKWMPDPVALKVSQGAIHLTQNIHPSPGLEEDAGLIAQWIQRESGGFRKLKDNPQA